jgi:hypothetical protein
VNGNLNLYPVDQPTRSRSTGRPCPLEIDRSASLAVSLVEVASGGRSSRTSSATRSAHAWPARLFAREPYRPGRIPLVFVHGTNSSAARWADMVNDLENDPRIRTQLPVLVLQLRQRQPDPVLGDAVAEGAQGNRRPARSRRPRSLRAPDGDRRDTARAALLTKMTVVDSGSMFWEEFSDVPFDQAQMSEQSRALVEQTMFVKPLPFVTRVIFISTPHQGSYLTGWSLVPRLAARLISLPRDLVTLSTDLANPANRAMKMQRLPTALDNHVAGAAVHQSPGESAGRSRRHLPLDHPGVGDGPLEDEVDGVVAYKSATSRASSRRW